MNVGETEEIVVKGKTLTIKKLAAGQEIGSSAPTYKVVDGPIPIAGYWYSERGARRGIRRRYRRHLERKALSEGVTGNK
ncbi:hypothetical protein JXL21_10430 [Candidatus Bathyarchaeota archaeon]|nr:hypothetical protein [Candidatus Bathyarchaeota archaeon]